MQIYAKKRKEEKREEMRDNVKIHYTKYSETCMTI